MATTNRQIPLIIAIASFIGSFLIPQIEFQDLVYMQGPILNIEEKKTAGFTIKIAEKNTIKVFNIPNSTTDKNEKIRNLPTGENIEIWYDSRYRMSKDSYDAWQISNKGTILIRYEDELETINLYKNIFIFTSLLSFLFYLTTITLARHLKS